MTTEEVISHKYIKFTDEYVSLNNLGCTEVGEVFAWDSPPREERVFISLIGYSRHDPRSCMWINPKFLEPVSEEFFLLIYYR